MSSLYLITGFLGAGKTTLLKNLIGLLNNRRLAVIINEFGKEGVDGSLLQSIGAAVREINNGSIFCSCRLGQFENALLEAARSQPEVILVEASGLSDPADIRGILSSAMFRSIEYQGGICVVDAVNFHKVIDTASACRQQLAAADVVILNKTDLAGKDELSRTKEYLDRIIPNIPIYETSFGKILPEWLCGTGGHAEEGRGMQIADITNQKFLIDVSLLESLHKLTEFVKAIAADAYRVKGFVRKDNKFYYVDGVLGDISITHWEGAVNAAVNKLVVLSGGGLPANKTISRALESFGLPKDSVYKGP